MNGAIDISPVHGNILATQRSITAGAGKPNGLYEVIFIPVSTISTSPSGCTRFYQYLQSNKETFGGFRNPDVVLP